MDVLARVEAELARYRHPLISMNAHSSTGDGGVDVLLQLKDPSVSAHTYRLHLTVREIENPRFSWAFQKLLYDSLHDYIIELFTDRP
ncbi:MAG: hypothetical protein PHX83_10955 [Acidobacteriia bacterium]|nr:hypothetical protein [Terriglobia bacterium]